jgi:hypothetical protein
MKKLSLASRLECWKHLCAAFTFRDACQVAQYLSENKRHPLSYQLLTSLYVLYGRPFKQRKQVRIPEELVPSEYSTEHRFLLDLRDKMFAHIDTDGLAAHHIEQLTKIVLRVQHGKAVPAIASLLPIGFQYERIRDLSNYLHNSCDRNAQEILLDAMDGSCPADLTYELDLRADDWYLLKPTEWKGMPGCPYTFHTVGDFGPCP